MPAPTVAQLSARLGADLLPAPGFTAPGTLISAVHISELPDPTPYLSGGELMLTTGLALPRSRIGCERYVGRLRTAGLAALALGLGPVHESPPDELVEACGQDGLCLLLVPAPTPFLTITKAYWSAVAQSTARQLTDAVVTQEQLVRAAGSEDPQAALLRTLARALDGWAALFDEAGRVDAVHPPALRERAEELSSELARLDSAGVNSAATLALRGAVVLMYPLRQGSRAVGYLAAAGPGPFAQAQRQVVLTASALLSLRAGSQQERVAVNDAYSRAVAIVLEAGELGAARRLALELGVWAPDDEVRVLAVEAWAMERVRETVRRALPRAVTRAADEHRLCVVLPPDHPDLSVLARRLVEVAPDGRSLISPVIPTADLGTATRGLLRRLDQLPAGSHELAPCEQSATLVRGLENVVGYGRADLTGALVEYLRHRGQWEPAARALQVHRNTLRQRIARCEQLLGARLDDPDVAAQLWLLLRQRALA